MYHALLLESVCVAIFYLVCAHPVGPKTVVDLSVSLNKLPRLLEDLQYVNCRNNVVNPNSATGAEPFIEVASQLGVPTTAESCKSLDVKQDKFKIFF